MAASLCLEPFQAFPHDTVLQTDLIVITTTHAHWLLSPIIVYNRLALFASKVTFVNLALGACIQN